MTIRNYTDGDFKSVANLFYETIHAVNAADYSQEQLIAWAPDKNALLPRRGDLLKQYALVAEQDGKIVGFGSIDDTGYLDLLYVHKNFQRQKIATMLCDELEKNFSAVTTHASITAIPFFVRRGYALLRSQQVPRRGVTLQNYVMKKGD